MVSRHPAIRRGLLERLAGEPPEVTRAVLGGPVGTQLERADLAGHPELTELWLLQSAASGRKPPMRAFDEIVDIRAAAGRSPRVDAALLRLLWPRGCPPDELAELLGIFTEPAAPDVVGLVRGAAQRRHRARDERRVAHAGAGAGRPSDPGPAAGAAEAGRCGTRSGCCRCCGGPVGGPQGETDAFAEAVPRVPGGR